MPRLFGHPPVERSVAVNRLYSSGPNGLDLEIISDSASRTGRLRDTSTFAGGVILSGPLSALHSERQGIDECYVTVTQSLSHTNQQAYDPEAAQGIFRLFTDEIASFDAPRPAELSAPDFPPDNDHGKLNEWRHPVLAALTAHRDLRRAEDQLVPMYSFSFAVAGQIINLQHARRSKLVTEKALIDPTTLARVFAKAAPMPKHFGTYLGIGLEFTPKEEPLEPMTSAAGQAFLELRAQTRREMAPAATY